MTISKEMWEKIEGDLANLYSYARFRLDGHDLFVRWGNISKNGQVYALIVGIDGFINFGHGYPSMDMFDLFTEKAWRKRSRKISIFKKRACDMKSKRAAKEFEDLKRQFPDRVQVWYEPFFMSPKSLITQYKRLDGIEYVEKEQSYV
jgi:hypothetical protein